MGITLTRRYTIDDHRGMERVASIAIKESVAMLARLPGIPGEVVMLFDAWAERLIAEERADAGSGLLRNRADQARMIPWGRTIPLPRRIARRDHGAEWEAVEVTDWEAFSDA